MLDVIGVLSFIGLPITFIGFIVQLVRKKSSKKIWGILTIVFLALFVISFALMPSPDSTDKESTEETETTEGFQVKETDSSTIAETKSKEKTDSEKFAEENNISVALAESIEYVLGQTGYTLASAYEMRQIDDWAEGQRYTIYVSQQYIWVFYVKDDEVQSIRQQKGQEFIYQKEE